MVGGGTSWEGTTKLRVSPLPPLAPSSSDLANPLEEGE